VSWYVSDSIGVRNDAMYVARRRYDRRMGYKLLGFIVWQGIRLYLRNSNKGPAVKAGAAGAAALVIAGAVVAGRQAVKQDQ
jgi:hypothetical protein